MNAVTEVMDELRKALALVDRLQRERDEARANYQWMVDRACDEKLDGYREFAAKCAQLEEERDEARARCETLRELADVAAYEQGVAQRRMMDAQRKRDEARAELAGLPAWQHACEQSRLDLAEAEAVIARRETQLDEARAEVERLRAEAAPMNEHFNAGYRDGARDAFKRGAEAMRETCARWMSEREGIAQWVYDDALSALPIPEEP